MLLLFLKRLNIYDYFLSNGGGCQLEFIIRNSFKQLLKLMTVFNLFHIFLKNKIK